jgi:hypothetical protein
MIDPSGEHRVETFVALAKHKLGILSQEGLDRGWQRLEEPLLGDRLAHYPVPQKGPRGRTWLLGFALASAVAALALLAFRVLSFAGSSSAPPLFRR